MLVIIKNVLSFILTQRPRSVTVHGMTVDSVAMDQTVVTAMYEECCVSIILLGSALQGPTVLMLTQGLNYQPPLIWTPSWGRRWSSPVTIVGRWVTRSATAARCHRS